MKKVKVGVSKRHIHLTEEVWKILFGDIEMKKRNDIGQPMQFASTSTVDLKNGEYLLQHVRVIGPIRSYNQIELSLSDAKELGLNPPRRQSGDLANSLPITILGPKGSINLSSGVILAERHIHMDIKMANSLNVKDQQKVSIYQNDLYLFDAKIKISDPSALELHIDTDEAKYYNLETDMEVDFEICGK